VATKKVGMTIKPSASQLTKEVTKPDLPISGHKQAIIESVLSNDVTIISSETGSGKSTQIPQFLLSAKHRFKRPRDGKGVFRVCITQPRRVAAISLAKRVSGELGESTTGHTVGYRVRFEESMSANTPICFLTDGMLVREAVTDSGSFSNYSVVVFDEVHERSLHTDLLIGLISRAIQDRRNTSSPLKVVIMSATLSVDMFQSFFRSSGATVKSLSIPGRTFPVSIWYTKEVEHDYVEASVCTVLQINEDYHAHEGDILVFLPGQDDIEAVSASLVSRTRSQRSAKELVIVHLFAALSNEAQSVAFNPVADPSRSRKVVLATNIAETSLTIPGIRFVVDCGLVKMKSMINSQLEVLRITPASKATVVQRAGRAGRERAGGQCFRLYRELDYERLIDNSPPEIVRCDMSSSLLQTYAMGIVGGPKSIFKSVSEFPFIDKPSDQSIARAELILKRIGAITSTGLTDTGKTLSMFPLHPLLGNVLINAKQFDCVDEALILVSLLSVDNLWHNSKNGGGTKGNGTIGDHFGLVEVFLEMKKISSLDDRSTVAKRHGLNPNAFGKAVKIEAQLQKLFKQKFGADFTQELSEDRNLKIVQFQRLLAKSLWLNCAKLVTRKNPNSASPVAEYETLDKIPCFIHPGSSLFGMKDPPSCVVYTEITQTTRNYMRGLTAIDGNWLIELVPTYFKAAASQ